MGRPGLGRPRHAPMARLSPGTRSLRERLARAPHPPEGAGMRPVDRRRRRRAIPEASAAPTARHRKSRWVGQAPPTPRHSRHQQSCRVGTGCLYAQQSVLSEPPAIVLRRSTSSMRTSSGTVRNAKRTPLGAWMGPSCSLAPSFSRRAMSASMCRSRWRSARGRSGGWHRRAQLLAGAGVGEVDGHAAVLALQRMKRSPNTRVSSLTILKANAFSYHRRSCAGRAT